MIMADNQSRLHKAAERKALLSLSAILAAAAMFCGTTLNAAGAELGVLPGTIPQETQMPDAGRETAPMPDSGPQPALIPAEEHALEKAALSPPLYGWQEYDGQKYYYHPKTGEMAAGWQVIDGNTYYFDPASREMAAGWLELDGEYYYFEPDTGEMCTGWHEIDGVYSYFEPDTGARASGLLELDGEYYYFEPDTGEMCTGWHETEAGRRYFVKKTGRMASGWLKISGKKYYFSPEDGEPLTGAQEIGGKHYIFNSKGQLAQSDGISLVAAGGRYYCADKNGHAASGWHLIKGKLYYASKTGKAKTSTTYQGIAFGSRGAAKNSITARSKIKAMQVFASITNENMTKSQKLAACWDYIISGSFRYAAKYPNLQSSGWQRKTAYEMLTSHSGNCYSFACAFAALASEAGYQPYVICGRVRGSRDRAADGYTRHAWVQINGLHYDPEAQYAGWHRGIFQSSRYPAAHTIQMTTAY